MHSIRRKSLVIFKSSFSRTVLVDERRARSRDYGDRLILKKRRREAKGRRTLDGSLVEGLE